MNEISSICVFCGANPGQRPVYVDAAVALGQELGRRQLGLVYGGGSVGLMGALARAARDSGVHVVGVIPESLTTRELMGEKIGELIIVESMHERKAIMASLADAFIALPGGFGTLEELFEVITWSQLGIHTKPIGLLNIAGFFDPLLRFIDHGVAEGFIRTQHRSLAITGDEPGTLLDGLQVYHAPPGLVKWLNIDEV
jgi:uncharacterized protein (TIGR00730 family)